MRPADLAAELERRQQVIDDLREQLAAADAENRRLRAHLDWWQDWGQCLRGTTTTLPESEWTLNNRTPEPDDAIAAWDETGRGAG